MLEVHGLIRKEWLSRIVPAIILGLGMAAVNVRGQTPALEISSPTVGVRPGEQVLIEYALTGDGNAAAIQWEEQFDSRFSVVDRTAAESATSASKEALCNTGRCLVFGMNSSPIPPGLLLRVRVQVSSTAAPGPAVLKLQNLVASTPNGNETAITGGPELWMEVLEPLRPTFESSGIVNAASFQTGLVPGSLATIFGTGLSEVSGLHEIAGATSYQGVRVKIGGLLAPLVAIRKSDGIEQINFQVPFEVAPGGTSVEVENNGRRTEVTGIPVLLTQPGIFRIQAGAELLAAILHQDGSLVSKDHPAKAGEIVSIYFTGGGGLVDPIATGIPGPIPPAPLSEEAIVSLDGVNATTLFAGYAPLAIGLFQLNLMVPAEPANTTVVSLVLRVAGAPAPPVLLHLH